MRPMILAAVGMAASLQAVAAQPLPVDLDGVEFGPIRFQLIQNGAETGAMYYELERRGDDILVHDGTTLLPDVRESLTGVFDAATLAPKSLLIDGDFSRTILDIDLTFTDGKASGVYAVKRPTETEKTENPFEVGAPENAILRPAFFGLAGGLPLEDGASFDFKWFAALSQSYMDATFSITGRKTIETPAGEFETFVGALKAQPENVLYLTTSKPHKVVRIDVPGQNMVFERLPDASAE